MCIGEDIKQQREARANNIVKSFSNSDDLLEKAHNHGDVHSNGKWYWESSVNGGRGDWRTIKGAGKATTATNSAKPQPKVEKKKQAKATADKDMKRMTFGEAESIGANKSVQAVSFDEGLVGWLYSSHKNFLSPIEEVFWSINLTKEQADRVSSNKYESEDVGFYQVNLSLSDDKQYADLCAIAKKINKYK